MLKFASSILANFGKILAVLGLSGIALATTSRFSTLTTVPTTSLSTSPVNQQDLTARWVVSVAQAKQLIAGGATVLDVRSQAKWILGRIPGAVRVSWQDFSQRQPPYRGKLLADREVLQEKLRRVGVSGDRPVVVVGNALNWGENGRIVWMLRTLGHQHAVIVDGGQEALVAAGVPVTIARTKPTYGNFTIQRTTAWEIKREELQAHLNTPELVVIDTREAREYAGATPYGETRGGTIPGAIHLYYQELLDARGKLLPQEMLLVKLAELGISQHTPVIAYCTGGVRSAFVVAVLADLGFTNVRNYAGSMWEWSAKSS